jgi:hypothetical protein
MAKLPAALLAHCGQFKKESWRDYATALADSGFRVEADFANFAEVRSCAPNLTLNNGRRDASG